MAKSREDEDMDKEDEAIRREEGSDEDEYPPENMPDFDD